MGRDAALVEGENSSVSIRGGDSTKWGKINARAVAIWWRRREPGVSWEGQDDEKVGQCRVSRLTNRVGNNLK